MPQTPSTNLGLVVPNPTGDGANVVTWLEEFRDNLEAAYAAGTIGTPAGTISGTASTTAPTGWMLCTGASLLRASYPKLFAAIGTLYGAVDGTHFSIPDYRGRVLVMPDGGAGRLPLNNALAQSGGSATVTLDVSQIPVHSHVNVINDPGHTHPVEDFNAGGSTDIQDSSGYIVADTSGGASPGGLSLATTAVGQLFRALRAATSTAGVSITNADTGGGGNHPNVQPHLNANVMIKL